MRDQWKLETPKNAKLEIKITKQCDDKLEIRNYNEWNNAWSMEIRMSEHSAMNGNKNDWTMRNQWKLEWLNNAWNWN